MYFMVGEEVGEGVLFVWLEEMRVAVKACEGVLLSWCGEKRED